MNYSNLIRIALKALQRNKFRAFLTMLGIIIGVASVIAMLAIGQGSKKSIQDQISTMGANMVMVMPASQQRGGIQFGRANMRSLTLDDVKAITEGCELISAISPEVRSSGQVIYGNKNWPTSIYGTTPQYLEVRKLSVTQGRCFTDREVKTMSKVCLIGQTVVEELFEDTNPIGQVVRFGNIPLKVVGVLSEKGQSGFGQDQDDLIIAPFTTVQKRILAITWVNGIFMSAVNEDKSEEAINQVTAILRKTHKLKPSHGPI
jgi:putative ABC transport system permease protein